MFIIEKSLLIFFLTYVVVSVTVFKNLNVDIWQWLCLSLTFFLSLFTLFLFLFSSFFWWCCTFLVCFLFMLLYLLELLLLFSFLLFLGKLVKCVLYFHIFSKSHLSHWKMAIHLHFFCFDSSLSVSNDFFLDSKCMWLFSDHCFVLLKVHSINPL